MSNTTHAKYRTSTVLASIFSLALGLFALKGEASQSTTQTTPAPGKSAGESLSLKQQSIVLIAASMAVSDMPGLNASLNQGLDAGLEVNEAKEVLVQLYAYTGFPRSLNALGELMKVVEERKGRGVQDAPGREPSRAIPTGDALIEVGKANQSRIAGAPVEGPLFEFAPIINQYLQGHLFGDIFERDNLDWQSRELATVGALSATPGVEAQLRSHVAASIRVGLSVAQMQHVIQSLETSGADEAAKRAEDALQQYLAKAAG